MMIPDATKHNPTPEYVRSLIERIGLSQKKIADHIGISERRLRYLLAGSRMQNGFKKEVLITYPEQFCLECLAMEAEKN